MTTYSYDTWSEKLTGIVTRDYLDTEIQNRSFEYSQAGDIETITDAVNNVVYSYVYDDLHRLKGETNSGPDGPLTYLYDAIGNMTSRIAGADAYTYEYNSPGPHAVNRVIINGTPHPYTYDDNGNMLTGKDFTNPSSPVPRTTTWNADNMPHSVSRSGVTTTFSYDGLGQRAKKQVGSATPTYYIGTEYEVISGVGTKYIFAGNLRIAKVSTTGVYYFHKDHLGSSTVMTGDTGAVVETSEYRPYGSFRNQSGTAVSDYKFTDQEWDAESGLYNYDARLYDPVIGRFISADTIVPDPFDPQLLNRYSYVRNNPIVYVDPSGHHLGGPNGPDNNTSGAFGGDDGSGRDPGNGHDLSDNGNGHSGISGEGGNEGGIEKQANGSGTNPSISQAPTNVGPDQSVMSLEPEIPHLRDLTDEEAQELLDEVDDAKKQRKDHLKEMEDYLNDPKRTWPESSEHRFDMNIKNDKSLIDRFDRDQDALENELAVRNDHWGN